MNALVTRINEDIKKLYELSNITNNKVRIIKCSGNPVNHIELNLSYKTPSSKEYPDEFQQITTVHFDFLDGYGIRADCIKATIKTKIFNPNVFPSGLVCFDHVKPTEFLDLLVKRLIRIITFDAAIINTRSPANLEARDWYLQQKRQNPNIFPTESLDNAFTEKKVKPTIKWRDLN